MLNLMQFELILHMLVLKGRIPREIFNEFFEQVPRFRLHAFLFLLILLSLIFFILLLNLSPFVFLVAIPSLIVILLDWPFIVQYLDVSLF